MCFERIVALSVLVWCSALAAEGRWAAFVSLPLPCVVVGVRGGGSEARVESETFVSSRSRAGNLGKKHEAKPREIRAVRKKKEQSVLRYMADWAISQVLGRAGPHDMTSTQFLSKILVFTLCKAKY